jgi:hypothetical protein
MRSSALHIRSRRVARAAARLVSDRRRSGLGEFRASVVWDRPLRVAPDQRIEVQEDGEARVHRAARGPHLGVLFAEEV